MKLPTLNRKNVLVGMLGLIAFTVGYFTPPSQACRRIQADCSYVVTSEACLYSGCGACDHFGMPCCYDERGYCINDPYNQGHSQICYGIC